MCMHDIFKIMWVTVWIRLLWVTNNPITLLTLFAIWGGASIYMDILTRDMKHHD